MLAGRAMMLDPSGGRLDFTHVEEAHPTVATIWQAQQ